MTHTASRATHSYIHTRKHSLTDALPEHARDPPPSPTVASHPPVCPSRHCVQSGFDDTCVGSELGINLKATIARIAITSPNQAPFFVLSGRDVPATGPAKVRLRWETVLRTDQYSNQLVELGNPQA